MLIAAIAYGPAAVAREKPVRRVSPARTGAAGKEKRGPFRARPASNVSIAELPALQPADHARFLADAVAQRRILGTPGPETLGDGALRARFRAKRALEFLERKTHSLSPGQRADVFEALAERIEKHSDRENGFWGSMRFELEGRPAFMGTGIKGIVMWAEPATNEWWCAFVPFLEAEPTRVSEIFEASSRPPQRLSEFLGLD
jgi:hypothetical protein